MLARDPDAATTFLTAARRRRPGDIFKNPNLAASLEQIARGGRDAFYKGSIAKAIAAEWSGATGCHAEGPRRRSARLGRADLDHLSRLRRARTAAEHAGRRRARDAQHPGGLRPEVARHNRAAYLHRWSRPSASPLPIATRGWATRLGRPGAVERMLSKEYAAARRSEIDPESAASYEPLALAGLDAAGPRTIRRRAATRIYLTAADREGNVVSLIQSLFEALLRHRRGRHRHRAAQPRQSVHAEGRPPEPDRARQAAVPHDHSGFVMKDGGRGSPSA